MAMTRQMTTTAATTPAMFTSSERESERVTLVGYNTKDTSNNISLHADDILLYITNPQASIRDIVDLIHLFCAFSGYRINWNKSELMPVWVQDPSWLKHLPFEISSEKFTYPGIEITKLYSSLFKAKNPVMFWLVDTSFWLDVEHEDCCPYSIGAVMMSLICLGKSLDIHKPIAHLYLETG